MGQSFLCKSFSSKINKTRRKEKKLITLHLLPWIMRNTSDLKIVILVDFKDYLIFYVLDNLLRIITDKYHINNNLSTSSTFSSIDSITKLLINLKRQLPTIRRLPKACRHLAADKLSSIFNNCLSTKSISSFENLLLSSYRAFNVVKKSDKSLKKHIGKRKSF
jgi:hypothetical protein